MFLREPVTFNEHYRDVFFSLFLDFKRRKNTLKLYTLHICIRIFHVNEVAHTLKTLPFLKTHKIEQK